MVINFEFENFSSKRIALGVALGGGPVIHAVFNFTLLFSSCLSRPPFFNPSTCSHLLPSTKQPAPPALPTLQHPRPATPTDLPADHHHHPSSHRPSCSCLLPAERHIFPIACITAPSLPVPPPCRPAPPPSCLCLVPAGLHHSPLTQASSLPTCTPPPPSPCLTAQSRHSAVLLPARHHPTLPTRTSLPLLSAGLRHLPPCTTTSCTSPSSLLDAPSSSLSVCTIFLPAALNCILETTSCPRLVARRFRTRRHQP